MFYLQVGLELGQFLVCLVFLSLELGLGVLLNLINLGIKGCSDCVEVLFLEVLEFVDLLAVMFIRVFNGTFFGAVVGNDAEGCSVLVDMFHEVGFG
jgi:hypothetical protein